MHRIVAIACTGIAVGLILSLSGCATPMEPRPIAGRAQSVPVEQAQAQCDFEGTRSIAGIQNLGLASYTYREVYTSCMGSLGYQMVEVGSAGS